MTFLSIFLQAAAEGGGLMSFLPLIAIIAVFWLFFLRPQAKKQKEETKFRNQIAKGAKVVTTSGIHGKVVDINDADTYLILEVDGGRFKIEKSAISKELSAQYLPKEEKGGKKK